MKTKNDILVENLVQMLQNQHMDKLIFIPSSAFATRDSNGLTAVMHLGALGDENTYHFLKWYWNKKTYHSPSPLYVQHNLWTNDDDFAYGAAYGNRIDLMQQYLQASLAENPACAGIALRWAARGGNEAYCLNTIQQLNLNASDLCYVAQAAAQGGHTQFMFQLIQVCTQVLEQNPEQGSNVKSISDIYNNCATSAAIANQLQTMRDIFVTARDLGLYVSVDQAIYYACKEGHQAIVFALLDEDLTHRRPDALRAFEIAVESGHDELARAIDKRLKPANNNEIDLDDASPTLLTSFATAASSTSGSVRTASRRQSF